MKKTVNFIVLLIFTFILAAFGTLQKITDNRSAEEKIISQRYVFKANYVIPTSADFQPHSITSEYFLRVTPDTVQAYLPYFGRAYEAPFNPSEGGIKFTSTNFNYSAKAGKKLENWIINIKINDQNKGIELTFDVWDNGKGDLRVYDQTKQPISFQGELE